MVNFRLFIIVLTNNSENVFQDLMTHPSHSPLTPTFKMSISIEQIDIISTITPFLSDQFLNTGTLSKSWVQGYGVLPKETRIVSKETTVEQFLLHIELLNHDTRRTIASVCTAAFHGRIDLLKVCDPVFFTKMTCESAAKGGNMECLKYLHSMKCDWDATTCHEAAYQGNLTMLKWAIENGCPTNHGTIVYAAGSGHVEMCDWLYNNGHKLSSTMCCAAVHSESTAVIHWMKSKGKVYSKTFSDAIDCNSITVLNFLREHSYPWNSKRVLDSLRRQTVNPETIRWLKYYTYTS